MRRLVSALGCTPAYDGWDSLVYQASINVAFPSPPPFATLGSMPAVTAGNCSTGNDGVRPASSGYGFQVTDSGNGHLFVMREDGTIWFWDGQSFSIRYDPYSSNCTKVAPYLGYDIAAASDTMLYATDDSLGSCSDGTCIGVSTDGGRTFAPIDGTGQGATSLAVDPVTGTLWIATASGRVKSHFVFCNIFAAGPCHAGWFDAGTTGFPQYSGAEKLAVYDGVPYVIVPTATSTVQHSPYMLQNGVWQPMGNIQDATSIARDRSNGTVYVVRGTTSTANAENLWRWQLIPN